MGTFQQFLTEQGAPRRAMAGSISTTVLPASVRRDGERLFELSMWLLGRDVRHGGNLLLRRGLARERLPEGLEGTSAYSVALGGGVGLTLWGFGALLRAWGESVFVSREGFSPRLVDASAVAWPVFRSADLGVLHEPRTPREYGVAREAVGLLMEWLAGHEEWVVAEEGLEYRRACVADRRKAPLVSVEALPAAWRHLASRVGALEPVVNDFTAPAIGV